MIYMHTLMLIQQAPLERDPHLIGKVYKALHFFSKYNKVCDETNNTFVTWNTHKFEKHLWALKLL